MGTDGKIWRTVLGDMKVYWKSIVLISAPIILAPLPVLLKSQEANCAFVVLLMAFYWVTEVAPLPVTAFLPVLLFPVMGIASAKTTCAEYLKDTNFVFVGGLVMAVALEESNLHKRVALRVMLWMGDEPRCLMMGFIVTSAFLSMWMSNTATAAMMLPIAMVILEELIRHEISNQEKVAIPLLSASPRAEKRGSFFSRRGSTRPSYTLELDGEEFDHLTVSGQEAKRLASSAFITQHEWLKIDAGCQTDASPETAVKIEAGGRIKIPEFHHLPEHLQALCKATMLCIAYGANLGGTGTLTGTGPNLIFMGQLSRFYPNQTAITYASWFLFGIPPMIICCLLGWALVVVVFIGWRSLFVGCCERNKGISDVQRALRQRYDELGDISFAEWAVSFWLVILVVLLILREPMFMPGWDEWLHLKSGYSSDACAGILIAFILFVFPNEKPDFLCFRQGMYIFLFMLFRIFRETQESQGAPKPNDLDQHATEVSRVFQWGVILLLGGGFALAEGVKKSGLSTWLGTMLKGSLEPVPLFVVSLVFVALTMFITGMASNSATASIFIPVAFSVADSLHINPLYLGLPTTLAASFAFMLPVATPPNAIVYESRMIKITEMIFVGFIMNLLCMCVTLIAIHTWSYSMFDLGTTPLWANRNSTLNATLL